MKTNYSFLNAFSKRIILVLVAVFSLLVVSAQTTVFIDDFNRSDVSPGGVPQATYAISNTGTGTNAYIDASIQLRLTGATQAAPTGVPGQHFVVGNLSVFSSPFKPKLSENSSDSIVWTFNMRYNYNGNLSGFNSGNRGYAVILAADGSDLTTANGYAVVNGGESPTVGRYRLVKFSGGLDDNANITTLVNGITLSNVRVYMSLKVKYESSTNTWTFYNRSDGATAWSDPAVITNYTLCGTSVDATYTSTTMTNFGFTQCYPASTVSFVALFDNFKVVASPNTTTAIHNSNKKPNYSLNYILNGFSINASDAEVVVLDVAGKIVHKQQIIETSNIILPSKGVYMVQIKSQNKIDVVKLLIR